MALSDLIPADVKELERIAGAMRDAIPNCLDLDRRESLATEWARLGLLIERNRPEVIWESALPPDTRAPWSAT